MRCSSSSYAILGLLALLLLLSCSEEKSVTPQDTTPPAIVAHFPESGATMVTRSGP